MRGIDWKPSQYVARGDMPNGVSWAVWVEDQTEIVKGGAQESRPWYWRTEVYLAGVTSQARGLVESSEQAMHTAWGALERLVYAFCTDASEDWPLALSSLLAAAETAVKLQGGGLKWPHNESFIDACTTARNVLARVPKEIP